LMSLSGSLEAWQQMVKSTKPKSNSSKNGWQPI
jgi:hypothetical protein